MKLDANQTLRLEYARRDLARAIEAIVAVQQRGDTSEGEFESVLSKVDESAHTLAVLATELFPARIEKDD